MKQTLVRVAAVALALVALVAGAGSQTPAFTGAPSADGRYANLYPFQLPTLGDLADWYWRWTLDGGTKPPPGGFESIPVRQTDLVYLRENRSDTTATWVGHATVLLQLAGLNVLTDPQFSQRASPFMFLGPERKVRVPFTIAEGPHVDVVLISHNHYDHLDAASVDALARQPGGSPLFVVPLGVDRLSATAASSAWSRWTGGTRARYRRRRAIACASRSCRRSTGVRGRRAIASRHCGAATWSSG